jgi:hypothetical protein
MPVDTSEVYAEILNRARRPQHARWLHPAIAAGQAIAGRPAERTRFPTRTCASSPAEVTPAHQPLRSTQSTSTYRVRIPWSRDPVGPGSDVTALFACAPRWPLDSFGPTCKQLIWRAKPSRGVGRRPAVDVVGQGCVGGSVGAGGRSGFRSSTTRCPNSYTRIGYLHDRVFVGNGAAV